MVLAPLLLSGVATANPDWVRVGAKGNCVKNHPPGHRLEVVQEQIGRGDTVAAAEDRARARAHGALKLSACANLTETACQAVMQRSAMNVAINRNLGVICAAVLVPSDAVADPLGYRAQDDRIAHLAKQTAVALAGREVRAVEVRTAAGCSLGDSGARLAAIVRANLASHGTRIQEGAETNVTVEVSPGEPVSIEAWLAGVSTPRALVGSTEVSAGWIGVPVGVLNNCAGDSALGVTGGARAGTTGAQVELTLNREGALCQGDPVVRAVVRPTRAQAVQVWSVPKSGEAWLLWSSAHAPGDPSAHQRVVLELEPVYASAAGEETLVALAAPQADQLPKGQVGCRANRLNASGLPSSVAIATVPFRVEAPGVGRCRADAATAESSPPPSEPCG